MDMNFLENLLGGVAVPVVALNRRLIIVAANDPARKVFEQLEVGIEVDKGVSKKRGFRNLLLETFATSVSTSMIIKLKQGFGQEFLATVKLIVPENDEDSRLLLVTFEDRSPLKDVKAMRSDFVANVSHEIRSPLTAISGFVETLQGAAKDDPEAKEHFLNLMAKETERMTLLVADLLSLSQVEVKERRAPRKIVDPNVIIAQSLVAASTLAEKRNKRLECTVEGTLPDLPGSHNDLMRVLINLLENAINYSKDDGIVRLNARLIGENNPLAKPALTIVVQDEGEGIPAEDIPRLTERFYRVDKSRSRNLGGTGLGLAIVKHILVRHRGALDIESTLGEGSTFSVFLPLTALAE